MAHRWWNCRKSRTYGRYCKKIYGTSCGSRNGYCGYELWNRRQTAYALQVVKLKNICVSSQRFVGVPQGILSCRFAAIHLNAEPYNVFHMSCANSCLPCRVGEVSRHSRDGGVVPTESADETAGAIRRLRGFTYHPTTCSLPLYHSRLFSSAHSFISFANKKHMQVNLYRNQIYAPESATCVVCLIFNFVEL